MRHLTGNDGMITVEMALLFPLLLFSILCICSLGFYFMDMARLDSKVQEVLVYASESVGRGEDVAIGLVSMKKRNRQALFPVSYTRQEQQLEQAIRTELENKLLYTKLEKITVSISSAEIRASVNYQAESNLWYWFSLRREEGVIKQRVRRICYADRLRRRSVQ